MMPDPEYTEAVDGALGSLSVDEPVTMRVRGCCMTPLIQDGALIRVRRKRFYWPGDIIVFRLPDGRLAVHRLIGIYPRNGLRYLTQPDRGFRPDGPVDGTKIVGRIVGGDCRREAFAIPIRRRLQAIARFAGVVAKRLAG